MIPSPRFVVATDLETWCREGKSSPTGLLALCILIPLRLPNFALIVSEYN